MRQWAEATGWHGEAQTQFAAEPGVSAHPLTALSSLAMGTVDVELALSATADVRRLGELYTPDQRHGLRLDAIFHSDIRFFVARCNQIAIGCGGIAIGPEFAEVKRMYVRREWRGRGVAAAILDRLIMEATRSGLRQVRLETGAHSTAAIRYYSRCGFRPCGPFGSFMSMPRTSVITSVFMEWQLA